MKINADVIFLSVILLVNSSCELAHQFDWETEFDEGTIFVSVQRGSDYNDGRRGKPVRSINAGIARALEKGYDTIIIEAGEYSVSNKGLQSGGTSNGVLIDRSNLYLSGGWSADFSRQSASNNSTVLKGSDPTVEHLMMLQEVSNITLEKLSFESSFADGAPGIDKNGAALGVNNCTNIVISNCSFNENWADDSGGAVYVYQSSGVTVTGSAFTNNVAVGGWVNDIGGALVFNDSNDCEVISSTFTGNYANSHGGAVAFFGSTGVFSGFKIESCTFTDNEAIGGGGGVGFYRINDVEIISCTFNNNKADMGGGVYIDTGNNYWINGNFTSNNSGGANGYGGAVTVGDSSSITISGGTYEGNFSYTAGETAGFHFDSTSNITISGATILATINTANPALSSIFYFDAAPANGQTVRILNNKILNSNNPASPQSVFYFDSYSDVVIMGNVISGRENYSFGIYENSAIGSPYRLEYNTFTASELGDFYYDFETAVSYTNISDLNDPDNKVTADSASGNTDG